MTEPVIRTDGRAIVLDLSRGARLCGRTIAGLDTAGLGALIEEAMAAAGTGFAYGRWGEPRALYASDDFLDPSSGEARTVHMGIDVFCAPGTGVFAPLAGVVECVARNDRELDYGPLAILRHAQADGEFFTLYGHLGDDVFDRLAVGRTVRAGERIASVGAPPGNGNWPPHLHFQRIQDLQGRGADFPGVAPASQQAAWLALSPSPAPFFPDCEPQGLEYPQCS